MSRSYTTEEVVTLLSTCDQATLPNIPGIPAGEWWRAFITALAETGLRYSILLKLRRGDLCQEGESPSIHAKSIHTDETMAVLTAPTRAVIEAMNASGTTYGDNDDPLFPWPYSTLSLLTTFRRLMRAAGIKNGSGLHGLRRTCLERESQKAAGA